MKNFHTREAQPSSCRVQPLLLLPSESPIVLDDFSSSGDVDDSLSVFEAGTSGSQTRVRYMLRCCPLLSVVVAKWLRPLSALCSHLAVCFSRNCARPSANLRGPTPSWQTRQILRRAELIPPDDPTTDDKFTDMFLSLTTARQFAWAAVRARRIVHRS